MADNKDQNEIENSNKRKSMDHDHEDFAGSNSGGSKRIRISDELLLSPSSAGSAESVTKSATLGNLEAMDLKVEKSETAVCMISNADFSGEPSHEEELKLLISGGEMESAPPSPLISTPERQSTTSSDSPPTSGGGGSGRSRDSNSSGRSVVVDGVMMPSAAEIEEFFSAAEKYEQKRFAEKYNYDVVKDVPVEGKYKWIPLKL